MSKFHGGFLCIMLFAGMFVDKSPLRLSKANSFPQQTRSIIITIITITIVTDPNVCAYSSV